MEFIKLARFKKLEDAERLGLAVAGTWGQPCKVTQVKDQQFPHLVTFEGIIERKTRKEIYYFIAGACSMIPKDSIRLIK